MSMRPCTVSKRTLMAHRDGGLANQNHLSQHISHHILDCHSCQTQQKKLDALSQHLEAIQQNQPPSIDPLLALHGIQSLLAQSHRPSPFALWLRSLQVNLHESLHKNFFPQKPSKKNDNPTRMAAYLGLSACVLSCVILGLLAMQMQTSPTLSKHRLGTGPVSIEMLEHQNDHPSQNIFLATAALQNQATRAPTIHSKSTHLPALGFYLIDRSAGELHFDPALKDVLSQVKNLPHANYTLQDRGILRLEPLGHARIQSRQGLWIHVHAAGFEPKTQRFQARIEVPVWGFVTTVALQPSGMLVLGGQNGQEPQLVIALHRF